MLEIATQVETTPKSILDQAFWSAVPSAIWFFAFILIIFWLRKEIRQTFLALASRLRQGDSFKIAGFEVGASYGLVANPGDFSSHDSEVGVYPDKGERVNNRAEIYQQSQGIMLVHQLQRAKEEGQLYDVLIYVIPHQSVAPGTPKCSLASVASIEYFFGSFWHNKVFPSRDRSRGFPVVTSAYGPFLCTAKIHFNDGSVATISRYIDFEMGKFAPSPRPAS